MPWVAWCIVPGSSLIGTDVLPTSEAEAADECLQVSGDMGKVVGSATDGGDAGGSGLGCGGHCGDVGADAGGAGGDLAGACPRNLDTGFMRLLPA